jgi:DNA repair protein RadC
MALKIKQLPEEERPYEKMKIYGEKKLSNAELLAIIIKSGTKDYTSIELANKVLLLSEDNSRGIIYKDDLCCESTSEKIYNNNLLQSLQNISIEELRKIKGIGNVKAIQIKAVCELARRMSQPLNRNNIKILSAKDVANLLMEELRFEIVEHVKLILLNSKNMVIKIVDISKGGFNSAIVEPKEILQQAVKIGSPNIVLVHNHPSGDSTPSDADIKLTKRLKESADILGIKLLDHIVIGDKCYTSIFSRINIS